MLATVSDVKLDAIDLDDQQNTVVRASYPLLPKDHRVLRAILYISRGIFSLVFIDAPTSHVLAPLRCTAFTSERVPSQGFSPVVSLHCAELLR